MSLGDELNLDPQGIGYAPYLAAGDNGTLAGLLNEPRYETIGGRTIQSKELLIWGSQAGRLARLRDAADGHPDEGIRAVAGGAVHMIQRADTTLDMAQPEIAGMVDVMVLAGVFTADDKAILEALSTAKISRAEQIGLGRVTLQEVRNATA